MRCVLPVLISIHALLAESDRLNAAGAFSIKHFYPRSPCGERLLPRCRRWKRRRFLSTLSLRRATCSTGTRATSRATFLSTLSLRRATASKALCATAFFLFLSTLSLRRATGVYYGGRPQHSIDFYPRSPCGERLFRVAVFQHTVVISIHALLAESDPGAKSRTPERDYFYPRSPCGERPYGRINDISRLIFLSTLSLRRATYGRINDISRLIFLSTLSLRRATKGQLYTSAYIQISIHALLAESDLLQRS